LGRRLLVPISEDVILTLERIAEKEGIPLRMLVERLLRASIAAIETGWDANTLLLLEAMRTLGATPVPLTMLDEIASGSLSLDTVSAKAEGLARTVVELAMINGGKGEDRRGLIESITRYVYPQVRVLRRSDAIVIPLTGLGDVSKSYISGLLKGFAESLKCRVEKTSIALLVKC